ncbi:Sas10 C-terminal domain-containing protein [Gigaspora rosea]|uniref:Sas10 C-terminal domain-containing protein n=1 Tax=Gigaspora rosea TaxID=44941 RepID=A0A397UE15_9GLOM|nr:Sas10 C-terminal domain-containing protein [Gigaspora rosea]
MGKRKRSFRPPPTYETGNDKFDNQGGRIKEITTWDDVEHDSEDDFYAGRDQILLDTYESHKHDESELSEEEVFPLETTDEDENEINILEEDSILDSKWGSRKENYYNADEISNLDDAKEEEEEALKLQKKRISQMSEDDFLDIDNKSLEPKMVDRKQIECTDNDFDLMSFDREVLNKERLNLSRDDVTKIIQSESPELIELLNEFKEKSSILWNTVTPLLEKARQKNLINDPAMKFISIKHQTLVHYLMNISFYLALKSFGAQHLRKHPVIDALEKLRMTWNKLERLERNIGGIIESFVNQIEQTDQVSISDVSVTKFANESKNEQHTDIQCRKKSKHKKAKKTNKEMDVVETSLQLQSVANADKDNETSNLQPPVPIVEEKFVSLKKTKHKRKRVGYPFNYLFIGDNDNVYLQDSTDFGDLDVLDEIDADEKAHKKKSLRHYASIIDQKLAKRENAILQSGDTDIPYKDNTRTSIKNIIADSQMNINTDLDEEDWNDYDKNMAADLDNEEDPTDFYNMVKEAKKVTKEQRNKQFEMEHYKNKITYEDDNVVPEGAKRQINYQILKNKGLTPHRKKEQRNPRVKHRNKYEKAKKKIKSIKRVFSQQEGSYGGEKTGIKTGLSRSIKLE